MSSIKQEAVRCLKCKKAQCSAHCPVSTDVPRVMELFLSGEIKKAGEVLFINNPLSAVTSIICPHEKNCTGHCVLGNKGTPVHFYEIEKYISDSYLDRMQIEKPEKRDRVEPTVKTSGSAGVTNM